MEGYIAQFFDASSCDTGHPRPTKTRHTIDAGHTRAGGINGPLLMVSLVHDAMDNLLYF